MWSEYFYSELKQLIVDSISGSNACLITPIFPELIIDISLKEPAIRIVDNLLNLLTGGRWSIGRCKAPNIPLHLFVFWQFMNLFPLWSDHIVDGIQADIVSFDRIQIVCVIF